MVENQFVDPMIMIKKISKLLTCNIPIFVGYDHVVSNSIQKVCELIKNNSIGNILTIDVEFRENWEGILLLIHVKWTIR